ncbi:MAG: L-arabinose isomerase [Bacteroidales bacterium]|nr:L-arabinose isomerase [Bacteroidales bacterium]
MNINKIQNYEVWFVTGSQHLYGAETLQRVNEDSTAIAEALNDSDKIPVKIIFKPVVTTPAEITGLCQSANSSSNCIGIIAWMHTFSPAKMWISGLSMLVKPLLHLHTQFNTEIPWDDIDMDFMNLNQSAHGDREFGFICTRLRVNRKVVVGHWQSEKVQEAIGIWSRAAIGFNESRNLKICRFGDNMRYVAVTEGDKLEAEKIFGWQVNYHSVGELVESMKAVTGDEVGALIKEYTEKYAFAAPPDEPVRYQARIELGMKAFFERNGYRAFTTNFEDLFGLEQLPGLAVQRLMQKGYGFGAEGDWKQSALVRIMKVMAEGMQGGCSFMEDYTYHLDPERPSVLNAHMLEICPSLAGDKPVIEVHPLKIGGKEAPARMVFTVPAGKGMVATLVDMGGRMRMIVNPVEVITPKPLPKLPVARALWMPEPDLETSAHAWILAGGAHHTSFSMALNTDHMQDLVEMFGIELLLINKTTRIPDFKKELRFNHVYYQFNK